MKCKMFFGALLVSAALCSQGFALELLDGMLGLHKGCGACGPCGPEVCAPAACCPEPAACEPACDPCRQRCDLFGGLKDLFGKRGCGGCGACDTCAPAACEAACPEPCAPACGVRGNLLCRLHNRQNCGACCEAPAACEQACEAPKACENACEPACDNGCGRRHLSGLLDGLFRCKSCAAPACEQACEPACEPVCRPQRHPFARIRNRLACKLAVPECGGCETGCDSCGGGAAVPAGAPAPEAPAAAPAPEAAPLPAAPQPDPSAMLMPRGNYVRN